MAWLRKVLALIVGIGAVVGVATIWGFFPMGIIVLLAVALLGALWVAWETHRGLTHATTTDSARRQHDARIVAEIRELITRRNIEWLRTWDFGGGWAAASLGPFFQLDNLNDVEHRPIDAELSVALRQLFDATDDFTNRVAENSFSEANLAGEPWRNVGWSSGEADGLEGDERRIWETRRDLLNAAADPVVDAYDEFVDLARRKLLLDAAERER